MLRDSGRRPQTIADLPFEPPPPTRFGEVTWLEPYPDALLESVADAAPGPDARYEMREAVGLAFMTALQRLPERQRAVLVLRDILGFRAAEVAEMLETSQPTVNSALQRARAALESRLAPPRDRAPIPGSPGERELARRFADAFERGELEEVVELLTDDAWVTMPPAPFEYQGRDVIASFLRHVAFRREAGGRTRLLATRANGQPAFGHYIQGAGERSARPRGVFVLTLEGDRISMITRFDGADLPERFGLPPEVNVS